MSWLRLRRPPHLNRRTRASIRGVAAFDGYFLRHTFYWYLATVTLFVVITALLYEALSAKVRTSFEADLHTTALSFTTDQEKAPGLFNSDQPVNATLEEASKLVSVDDPSISCGATGDDPDEARFALENMQLSRIDVPPGTQATLSIMDGALRMEVTRPQRQPDVPMALFTYGPGSRGCGVERHPHASGTLAVYSATGASLQLLLRYGAGTALPTEPRISVNGKLVSFEDSEGHSALAGGKNTLTLVRENQTISLQHSRFEPTNITHGRISELSLERRSETEAEISGTGDATGGSPQANGRISQATHPGNDNATLTAFHLVLTGQSPQINIVSVFSDDAYNAAESRFASLLSGYSANSLRTLWLAIAGVIAFLSTIAGLLSSLAVLHSNRMDAVTHYRALNEPKRAKCQPASTLPTPREG